MIKVSCEAHDKVMEALLEEGREPRECVFKNCTETPVALSIAHDDNNNFHLVGFCRKHIDFMLKNQDLIGKILTNENQTKDLPS